MSIAPKVISEYAHIKFNVLDKRYCGLFEEAYGFVKALLTTVDKAKLKFSEIVACRSVILNKEEQNCTCHEQHMWHHPGPFTPEQILNMIRYEPGISNQDWYKHLAKAGGVQVVQQ
jgi:hypothetical protein